MGVKQCDTCEQMIDLDEEDYFCFDCGQCWDCCQCEEEE